MRIRASSVYVCGWTRAAAALLAAAIAVAPACRRAPAVSEETYRQAVSAFYVSLAAMQTSQDVLARRELDRLVQLVPDEPAGWANLGLLLLRQQQVDDAAVRLAKAAEIAPRNAAIERLVALAASRKGSLEESVKHWRRAIELDGADLKAPYALALELERLGGGGNEAEAERLLETLATRSRNLAAQIELARIAAKRNDAAALGKALDALAQGASSWPADAKERLKAVRDAAQGGASAATTAVVFLKNVLIREPAYRAALAEVSTPRSEVGEPLLRFVTLRNPEPQPAAPDEQLAFSADSTSAPAVPASTTAGVFWLAGDARPALFAVTPRLLLLDSGIAISFLHESLADAGPDGIAAADLNYDFRNDLVLAGSGGVAIFRQTEKAAFVNATAEAKLPPDITRAPAYGVWPADVDTDGDLDLVLARRDGSPLVLRNNSDNTFAVQTPFTSVVRARGFVWADLDGEGVPDAALIDESGTLRVFLNLRGSQFREQPVPAQFPRVAAIAAADITGDGILDLVAIATDGTIARLAQSASGAAFDAATVTKVDPPSDLTPGRTRMFVADLDNNGAGDLVISTRTASRVLLGGAGGTFRPAGGTSVPADLTAAADLDGDGRLELVGRSAGGARIVRVKGQKAYRWQSIRPRAVSATGDQRINSFGIGGEVEVRTGLHAQKQVIAAPVVHFGLGEASAAEVARIVWPNGVLQSEFDLATNAAIAASQRLKGSCPWLFAWNGTGMGFVTDFIWRSPLGLRINAQATADVQMTEDWVKIRGDQLAARGGAYDLRITAELWETHFFDLVSLLAVDHPEGTEVFVDERFAVPAPRLGIVATSPVQELAAVRDDLGNDVRDIVRARDDRHLDFAGRGRYQGITRQHSIELTLPESAPRSGPLWLIAQGWVHPTDSSINVAIAQGNHAPAAGLSLHVADASGRYTLARAGLGFPAGKDKTVLIDLSGLFRAAGPRRMRLTTNLEIFWDRIGWAGGRPDVALEPRKLPLQLADLQYRGYSVTDAKNASTPERPRYELAGIAPRWRDLEGFHTRFGDVRELLAHVDDRYVIMNAGDELRLAFPEAPPPRAGFVRDFVLVGDGWVKDGDYNTVASRTVLPLPTHQTPGYAGAPTRLEDDPVYRQHREDFERYHTRYVTPDAAAALRVKIDPDRP